MSSWVAGATSSTVESGVLVAEHLIANAVGNLGIIGGNRQMLSGDGFAVGSWRLQPSSATISSGTSTVENMKARP
jgi:hypothetical protein